MSAGRTCPMSYRYAPSSLDGPAAAQVDILYVVGGLYGNEAALTSVLKMFHAERGRKHLIFNGDFNWFNVDPDSFKRINDIVLSFDAIRGNVETELAAAEGITDDTGCGCAYPEWVDDSVVQYSNSIMQSLAKTAMQFPQLQISLAGLPMVKRISVGGLPVGIVHGDAASLAGWGFAQENLADALHLEQVRYWFDEAQVRVFACSHTCLPVFHRLSNTARQECLVANNGAAGMPNFSGLTEGLVTRIATSRYTGGPSWATEPVDNVVIEALPVAYDHQQWQEVFLRQWPAGSAAHLSYWQRICRGPAYSKELAFRLFDQTL
jgi:hypothetical protein